MWPPHAITGLGSLVVNWIAIAFSAFAGGGAQLFIWYPTAFVIVPVLPLATNNVNTPAICGTAPEMPQCCGAVGSSGIANVLLVPVAQPIVLQGSLPNATVSVRS